MEFKHSNNVDKYGQHRYIALLTQTQNELYIGDIETDNIVKLCNVSSSDVEVCFFEERGFIFITNLAEGAFGFDNIQLYDIKTLEKVYERSYGNNDYWVGASSDAIFNFMTGEYLIYNSRTKQVHSQFVYCQYYVAPQYTPQTESCIISFNYLLEGRRRVLLCRSHEGNPTFFFDYTEDKLKLMPICFNKMPSVDEISSLCKTFLEQREGNTISCIADELEQFFVTKLQLLCNYTSTGT
ncbi:unnamed protein product [Bursaphelenchus okinawaensis]|uniref:Uncharacterized protein n=1 Tax=Bursaphelenchus okinawaensis TaxID=465554 RepID=A0A811LJ01_9BILA|nr:unnamed protein product [Bursaphelenchus okinawaensis]CAG9123260.1 unnamed protein product [Bursaphelenchus okinawaensis]